LNALTQKRAGYIYTPLDEDTVCELLTDLWGALLTREAIEEAFKRLTEDGASEWPRAWCQDDLDEIPLSEIDETAD
jgi:hypothetical protein